MSERSEEIAELKEEISFLNWILRDLFHEMVGEMELRWDDAAGGMNEGQLTLMTTRQEPHMHRWLKSAAQDWPDAESWDYMDGQYSAHRASDRCFSETIGDTTDIAQEYIEWAQEIRDIIEFLKEVIGFLLF